MDLKVMPRSHKWDKFILCIIDEVTNYLITVPIYQAKSEEIGEALIEDITTKYCIPEYLIMDQDSAFLSSLMTYLWNKFNIKIRTAAPYNHQSLQAEHSIKSLSTIHTKHKINLGQMWKASWKVTIKCVDPVVIYKIIDPHNYLLMTLDGRILR